MVSTVPAGTPIFSPFSPTRRSFSPTRSAWSYTQCSYRQTQHAWDYTQTACSVAQSSWNYTQCPCKQTRFPAGAQKPRLVPRALRGATRAPRLVSRDPRGVTPKDVFAQKLEVAEEPTTHTKVTVQEKNNARKALEKDLRQAVERDTECDNSVKRRNPFPLSPGNADKRTCQQ